MNKLFAIVLICTFCFTTKLFSCFVDEPQSLFPKVVSADFSNGASWQVQFTNIKTDKIQINNQRVFQWYDNSQNHEGWLQQYFRKNNITVQHQNFYKYAQVLASFPLTINCSFNPFEITNQLLQTSNRVLRDQNGNAIRLEDGQTMNDTSKVVRFCLLYFGKNKRWILHKDIKNPNVKVITNNSQRTSLFGKYVFQNKYGFKQKQIMFVVPYFETENGFKSHPNGLNDLMKRMPHQLDGVIRIGVLQNTKPR